jgi:CRP-like cAMP-binding protein
MSSATYARSVSPGAGIDRRVTPRVGARLPVQMKLAGQPSPLRLVTCDVGSGGVCVESPFRFELAAVQRIVIEAPGLLVEAAAAGRWQKPCATRQVNLSGIQLLDVPKPQRTGLWDLVNHRAAELAQFLAESGEFDFGCEEDAVDVALATRANEVPPGVTVFPLDSGSDRAGTLCIVHSGAVVLEGRARGARVLVQRVGPGGLFGGLPALAERPEVLSAMAEERTLLLEIDPYTVGYLRRARPYAADALVRAVLRTHARTIEHLLERLADGTREQGTALRSGA